MAVKKKAAVVEELCARCSKPSVAYLGDKNNGWDGLSTVREPVCADCRDYWLSRRVRVSVLAETFAKKPIEMQKKFDALIPVLLEDEDRLAKLEALVFKKEPAAA